MSKILWKVSGEGYDAGCKWKSEGNVVAAKTIDGAMALFFESITSPADGIRVLTIEWLAPSDLIPGLDSEDIK